MKRLLATAIAAFVIAPGWCLAAEAIPAKHSTVHVVFISPQSQPARDGRFDDAKSMARPGH